MHKVTLHTLTCHVPDETYGDEVYLTLGGEKIWPKDAKFESLKVGDFPLKVEIEDPKDGDTLTIELWDHDVISANDKLGKFELVLVGYGGDFNTEMQRVESKTASYSLNWDYY